uniref:Putative secreted protein n=1 Tax=Anopheles darlingi TaxID=43151 RepID=A0A2M4DGJ6_ANODA
MKRKLNFCQTLLSVVLRAACSSAPVKIPKREEYTTWLYSRESGVFLGWEARAFFYETHEVMMIMMVLKPPHHHHVPNHRSRTEQ